jgi:hypothetical protein
MFLPLKTPSGQDLKYGLIIANGAMGRGQVIVPDGTTTPGTVKTGGGTTGALLGVCVALANLKGEPLEKVSITVGANNQTVEQIQAQYLPLWLDMEYSGILDADAATTTHSNKYGNFAVEATGKLLDESSYVAYTTVIAKQFFSFGVTPGTTRNVTGMFIKKIGFTA